MRPEDIGLGAWRKQHVGTRLAFANQIGIDHSTVFRWETGKSQPEYRHRQAIAETYNLDIAQLNTLLEQTKNAFNPAAAAWDNVKAVRAQTESLQESNLEPHDLGHLERELWRIVAEYEHHGPSELAPKAVTLRKCVHRLLQGRQNLRDRQHLYRIAAQLAGLLSYMAVNTGRFHLAEAYCQQALGLADELNDVGLQIWAWGTRSFCRYYQDDYIGAYQAAAQGRELAPANPQAIRLLANGEARALGRLGDRAGVNAAVERALDLLECHAVHPDLTPCISFEPYGYMRVAANAATAYVALGDTHRVLRYTHNVESSVEQADSNWSRALVNLDLAQVLLRQPKPDLEQALHLGRQALEVSAQHPIRSVWQRSQELHALALTWAGEACVTEFTDALRTWRTSDPVREISG
ncbi:helix-turn-helix transcriptional regulator [Saccharopolyspora shandongensis]|uniref:helix-turn-helix transcriptional regulator n=1 Tax=Saccharopolyspora shandongensis TaxID=418495 RepID=UPI0033D11C03